MANNTMVSIIIRTKQRPDLLRRALKSLEQQTYKAFEVLIVEDGEGLSANVVTEFPSLFIRYVQTGKSVGRTKAANIGLAMSSSPYINFLDDDDLFLPHHIESLLNMLETHKEADAAHAPAIERKSGDVLSEPQYLPKQDSIRYNEAFNKETIFYRNMFPIQAVMFKRKLYELYGGMDESLDLLEDWDLWIRYGIKGDFIYSNNVTSIYHIPIDSKKSRSRKQQLKSYEKQIWNKYRLHMQKNGFKRPGTLKRALQYLKRDGLRGLLMRLFGKI